MSWRARGGASRRDWSPEGPPSSPAIALDLRTRALGTVLSEEPDPAIHNPGRRHTHPTWQTRRAAGHHPSRGEARSQWWGVGPLWNLLARRAASSTHGFRPIAGQGSGESHILCLVGCSLMSGPQTRRSSPRRGADAVALIKPVSPPMLSSSTKMRQRQVHRRARDAKGTNARDGMSDTAARRAGAPPHKGQQAARPTPMRPDRKRMEALHESASVQALHSNAHRSAACATD